MDHHHTPSKRMTVWEHDRHGQFALEQEKHLLLQMTSTWRRRQRRLLQIECGTGKLLQVFWEAGFDLTATASRASDMHKARTRIGHRAELHLAQPDDLPFDDKSFDYVLLLTALDYCPRPKELLKEAARVCAKEMLISFLNKHSLYALSLARNNSPSADPCPNFWWSWSSLLSFLRHTLGPRPVQSQRGILPGPYKTWQPKPVCRMVNSTLCPNTFGAYCALRLDMTADPVVTPLPAWVQPRPKPSAPYSNRIQGGHQARPASRRRMKANHIISSNFDPLASCPGLLGLQY